MLTPEQLSKMSDAELEAYLDTAAIGTIWRQVAFEELSRRRLRAIQKGHWTVSPAFWVLLATLLIALIAAWPISSRFVRMISMVPQLPPELPVVQGAMNFVRACESIHPLMARGPLNPDDLDLIEYSAIELLGKLRRIVALSICALVMLGCHLWALISSQCL